LKSVRGHETADAMIRRQRVDFCVGIWTDSLIGGKKRVGSGKRGNQGTKKKKQRHAKGSHQKFPEWMWERYACRYVKQEGKGNPVQRLFTPKRRYGFRGKCGGRRHKFPIGGGWGWGVFFVGGGGSLVTLHKPLV